MAPVWEILTFAAFPDARCDPARRRTGPLRSRRTHPLHPRRCAECSELSGFSNVQRARKWQGSQVSTMRRSAHTGGVSDEELPQGARHALLFEAIQRARIRGRFSEAKRPPVCPISHDPWTGGSGHSGAAAAGADGEEFNDSERAAAAEHELSSRSTWASSGFQQQRPRDARAVLPVLPPGALRVVAAADGRLEARLVLHSGRSMRLPATAGRLQCQCRGWDGWG